MRSCHELVEILLHSTSSPAEQQKAAAALAELLWTPGAWNTAVSAIPALADLLQQPTSSAAMREQVSLALDHMRHFAHADQDLVGEVIADVIVSIVQLLKHDAILVQIAAAWALKELSLDASNHAIIIASNTVCHPNCSLAGIKLNRRPGDRDGGVASNWQQFSGYAPVL